MAAAGDLHRLPCRLAGDGGASATSSLVVARAGAVAPTTTSARGATRLGHPIASSIHPRRDTPAGRGVSQVPVSQFLTSQPLEDGTDCEDISMGMQYSSAFLTYSAASNLDTWAGAHVDRPAGV